MSSLRLKVWAHVPPRSNGGAAHGHMRCSKAQAAPGAPGAKFDAYDCVVDSVHCRYRYASEAAITFDFWSAPDFVVYLLGTIVCAEYSDVTYCYRCFVV